MRVTKTIKPGQNGSQRFLRQYGHNLVNVRYREDLRNNCLYTTIEIIVDQRERRPGVNCAAVHQYTNDKWVAVKISYQETELRTKAKRLGAQWSPGYKVWVMLYTLAVELTIADRVNPNLAAKIDDVDLLC